MSNSIRDQLLKAGLVDESTVKQAEQSQRRTKKQRVKKAKQAGKAARREATQATPETRRAAEERLRARAERDRDLERARRLKEERRALKDQINQIIARQKLDRAKGEIAYNFIEGKRVKRIYVTAAVRDRLSAGNADIVKAGNSHEVVDATVAEKLRALDPTCVVPRRDRSIEEEEAAYADHPIPDDLDW